MKKNITLVFSDDNLRNKETKITVAFGAVIFNSNYIVVERAGYNSDFLDFAMYCDDIKGYYNNNRTFIEIPVTKIVHISVK